MKFPVGWELSKHGIDYRVVKGNRCLDDRVIEIKTDGWVRPKIAHTLIMADFKFQVEENNYGSGREGSPVGKVKQGSGWHYLKWAIIDAFHQGWERVAKRIDEEVERLHKRGQ